MSASSAGSDTLDQPSRRVAFEQREADHSPSVPLEERSADDAAGSPISPLHEHVGPEPLDHAKRGRLIKDRDIVYALKRGQEERAVSLRENRSSGTLE